MKRALWALAVLALVATSLLADGQETGIIEGRVSDSSGNPLPGVAVSLQGPRGTQDAVTDGTGSFRFTLLPPGAYTVKAEMDGFQPKQSTTAVSAGGRAEVDLQLRLGTSEEITVTSEAPLVDKFNVTAGATVSAEIGEQTAGASRTYYGLVNSLPGVTSDSENADIQNTRPTVNGAHWADQQVFVDGVDTSFARFGGSRVFLPTTAVTEVTMEAGGSGAEYGRKIGSTTNVIVKSGGNQFHADANVTYQTVDWQSDWKSHPELLRREDFPTAPDALHLRDIEKNNDSTGYELSAGGPLKRDKAWFFLGWSDFDSNDTDKALNDDPLDVSLSTKAEIVKFNFQPGAQHQIAASWIDTPSHRVYAHPNAGDYWSVTPHATDGQLGSFSWNWSINSKFFLETKAATQTSDENKFLACFNTDLAECTSEKQQDRGPDGTGPLRYPSSQDHPFLPPSALGEHYPGDNFRVYIDTENDSAWYNGWILDNGFGVNEFPRQQANAALTQFLGSNHELKYGVDWQEVEWNSDVQRPGLYSGGFFDALNPFGYAGAGGIDNENCGILRAVGLAAFGLDQASFLYALNNGLITPALNAAILSALFGSAAGPGNICVYRDYNAAYLQADRGSGDSKNEDLALYARDRFTLGSHWTFNLGLRYEDTQGQNDIGRVVFQDQHISPRVAVTYDLTGDGKQLLTLTTGRYYAQLNQQWTNQWLQDKWGGYEEYVQYLFCDPVDAILIPGCGGKAGYNLVNAQLFPGRMWELVDEGLWDSNIKPYYKDEIIGGYEWQFTKNWALNVKGIWWELGDVVGATYQLGPDGEQFPLVANYKDYPAILRLIRDEQRRRGTVPVEDQVTDANLDAFRPGTTEYRGLQLQLNRRFSNGFSVYNNITWSESKTDSSGAWWNNTNSDYGSDFNTVLTQADIDACNADQFPGTSNPSGRIYPVDCDVLAGSLGQPVSTINRFGNARSDKPIIFNSFGFKVWNFGRHDFTLGGHFSYQSGEPWGRSESVDVDVLSGSARSSNVGLNVEPDGARRLDDFYTLNLQVSWGFPLGGSVRGNLKIEGLNVTDSQEVLHVSGRGEVRAIRRDFQRPRQVRAVFSLSL